MLIGKGQLVFTGEDLVSKAPERIVGNCSIFFGAQDETHWRILAWVNPILPRIVQVQVHLAGIRVSEFSYLQFNDQQASEPPMKKQQIDPIPFRSYAKTFLPGYECEVVPKLKQKAL